MSGAVFGSRTLVVRIWLRPQDGSLVLVRKPCIAAFSERHSRSLCTEDGSLVSVSSTPVADAPKICEEEKGVVEPRGTSRDYSFWALTGLGARSCTSALGARSCTCVFPSGALNVEYMCI